MRDYELHFFAGVGDGFGACPKPIMRLRTSGGRACMAFCISSGVIGRFNDSGTGTGTPGCPDACLRIGFGVGEDEILAVAGDAAGAATAGDGCDEAPD